MTARHCSTKLGEPERESSYDLETDIVIKSRRIRAYARRRSATARCGGRSTP